MRLSRQMAVHVRRSGWVAVVAICSVLALAGVADAHVAPHGDDFAAQQTTPAPDGVTAVVTGRALAAGPRTVAVVLANFASAPAEPFTPDQVRTAVFTGSPSVNQFEQDQSFGAISLTGKLRDDGDVFGWFTIDADTTVCAPGTWRTAVNDAAIAAGVDLTGYTHTMYIFQHVDACPWAGTATVGGGTSYMNGTMSVGVISHELGHNLGAHHATAINCVDAAGVRVSYSGTCTAVEYGDPFDVMGSSKRHSVAFRKVTQGWLPAASAVTVTESGTYPLAASNILGAGTRSVRIQRGTSPEYWYLETRAPVGVFDNFTLGDPAVTGVGIRLAGDYAGKRTQLIDMHPLTTTFSDAPLQPGERFTDPATGAAIDLEGVALGVASVRITFPSPPPPRAVEPVPAAPGPSPAPAASPTPTVSPGAPPADGVIPPPAVSPAPASSGAARIALTRRTARLGVLRLNVTVPSPATRCAVRVAAGRWVRCRVVAGRVMLSRTVTMPAASLRVAIMLNGVPVLVTRVRVPALGATTRVVTSLRSRR